MPNSSSKESDRRYTKRKSSDEEHYSKSIPNYSDFNSRNSGKDKKSSLEVKQPIRSVGEWSEFLSSSGKIYYYNCKSEKAQWDKPDEWEWLLSQEEKNPKNEKNSYKSNRYRSKYDEDQLDSKSQRYNDNHKSYPRDYSNVSSNLGSTSSSSSFRQNSYNSYNNSMNEPHRAYNNNGNLQSSCASTIGTVGGEYYENNSNMSSSSSNDYYNYRNYGQLNKNEQDKYWNDSRAKGRNIPNQKMDDLSYKISPSRYPPNMNYNNYDDQIPHGSKQFMYQKQQHPSRFENYNDKSLNDQYHSSSMYNNNNNNSYYNSNDIEMRDNNRYKYSIRNHADDINENFNSGINTTNLSRTTSRSKSSNSNMSRSVSSSRRSSMSNSSSGSYKNSKKHKKSKKKSRKRSKKQHDCKNSKLKTNSPSKTSQIVNKNDEISTNNDKNETDANKPNQDTNEIEMQQTDTDKLNNSLNKTQKSLDESKNLFKSINEESNNKNINDSNTNRKETLDIDNGETSNHSNKPAEVSAPVIQTNNTNNNSTTSNHNTVISNHNSIFMPVLVSSVEDINKYYKPELLTRLIGIDLNENLNLVNSQVFMKHLQCTSLAAELKNYRSLVRFKEIKKTLQEQRLQFLQNQMKEIEELLN